MSSVAVRCFSVPTEEAEADGTLTWDHTGVVTAEVAAGGEVGLGFTYGPRACAALIDDVLGPAVVGGDAMDVPASWQTMARATRNSGRPGVVAMAIAAVDIALWDLKARLLDLPLATLLGRVRHEVPVYGSGGFTSMSDDQLRAQLSGWVDAGMGAVKIKIGEGWGTHVDRDLHRARVARQVIGDGVDLMVDANGGYSRKQAVRVGRRLDQLGVGWFEEPVSSNDREGLHQVRGRLDADIAAGEYGYRLVDFSDLLGAGAVDVMQADVSRCGGITEWLRVAALVAAHELEVSGHTAQSLHAHAACAVPNLRHLEYFADHARVDRLLFDGVLDPDGGVLRPSTTEPGHGLRLKEASADAYRTG